MKQQHIVVIGAGYAGLTAALRLDRRHRITLINAEKEFTQRIRLHEYVAGRPSVTVPLTELTRGTGITVVQARVGALDPAAKLVHTTDGRQFSYDTLVYALGSRTDLSVPGTADHAYTVEQAAALRTRLTTPGGGTLAVVGGGLTGVELTTELAEAYPAWRISLVTGELCAGLSPKGRAHVRKALTSLGVTIHPDTHITAVKPGTLITDRGDIEADVIAWAGPFAVPTLAAESGLAVDGRGRAKVDETMRSISHPDVYIVGDAAAAQLPNGDESRMSCAVGIPTAAHAADAINARTATRTAKPFRYAYLLQCVSLGRNNGLVQFVHPDDSPRDLVLTGRTAAWIKEGICRSTMVALRLERRRPGSTIWRRGRAR
ncbi:NAD(P)/FAD-dependent oxidoreductase [Sinosporangium siamense]|nr:FAD-dependent oxidoreductase [Sinosporangium siamense]